MPFTYAQIGARAKQKSPELLGRFSDEDIGRKLAERDPDIAKLVAGNQSAGSVPTTAAPAPSAPTIRMGTPEYAALPAKGKSALSYLLGDMAKSYGKGFEAASKFVAGTTGKTVGSLISSGIGGAAETAGKIIGSPELAAKGVAITKAADAKRNITPSNIALTALEIYPAGGGKQVVTELEKGMARKLGTDAFKSYFQALNPTKEEMKRLAQKYVPEAIRRGVRFNSIDELVEKASANVTEAGKKIEEVWQTVSPDKKIEVAPLIDALAEVENKYRVEGKILNSQAVNAVNRVFLTISQFGDQISPQTFRKVRQVFDEAKDFTKSEADSFIEKSEKAAANAIRSELAKEIPELSKVNAEYTFWESIKDIAKATQERRTGQATPLGAKIAGSALGGVAGSVLGENQGGIGGGIGGFGVGLVLGQKGTELLTSPMVRTAAASLRYNLALNIAKGKSKEALAILAKIAEGAKNLATPEKASVSE